jgi:hypothetical protein
VQDQLCCAVWGIVSVSLLEADWEYIRVEVLAFLAEGSVRCYRSGGDDFRYAGW